MALVALLVPARGRAQDSIDTLQLIEREEGDALEVGFSDVLEVAVKRSPTLLKSELDVQVADALVTASRGEDDYVLDSSIRADASRQTDPGA